MVWSLIVGSFLLFLWLLPFIMVATSDKTTGKEKVFWLLILIFVSWFAWIFYLLLAPIKSSQSGRY